jgi:hypothetical protein
MLGGDFIPKESSFAKALAPFCFGLVHTLAGDAANFRLVMLDKC